ncbi:MAG: DUF1566 domain-containing protein [Bacteroidetes bacterium]|nr:DUF1566 domain-containing protein [Bacteroidota bacterium]
MKPKMTKAIYATAMMLFFAGSIFAQYGSVGINNNGTSPNASAMLDVSSTSKGLLIPNVALLSTTDVTTVPDPALSLLVYNTAIGTGVTPGYYYYNGGSWAALAVVGHYIGELYQDGMIFWVDNTGQHGLIVSFANLGSSGESWSDPDNYPVGSNSTWNGQGNSTKFLALIPSQYGAATLCDNYSTGIYSDWYLPAIDELSLIYHVRYILNKNIEGVPGANILGNQSYWSSTEVDNLNALNYDFNTGYASVNLKSYGSYVRAVRAF